MISLIGPSAGVLIVTARTFDSSSTGSATVVLVLQLCGAVAVITAWLLLLLHFGYADRHAHLYYPQPNPAALSSGGTERPNLMDFACFPFTVGSSFAASEAEVQDRQVRYTVLTPGIPSFISNTAVRATAISVFPNS
ncbi:DUF1345 domain-containing protein [Amycolatopsis sp. FDAARGOS 1241]|uniref:DUF1345 domain-containing protein n=1 Tax=Amycolatopsis sp. FDAARGOS 1241 TaxID=2778070 RepID=UPI001950D0E6|nr:DUF1345 domain-containing protein [Amycolatopsis sp. FDAARGOS 1241]QRP43175.1 DUF1345 domain-containing protein [Amycolatopsis sp. FDAARGOS 1241]